MKAIIRGNTVSLKPCPFCGGKVRTKQGFGNITFFNCTNPKCRAVVSFGGNKETAKDIFEAADPVAAWNQRVNEPESAESEKI